MYQLNLQTMTSVLLPMDNLAAAKRYTAEFLAKRNITDEDFDKLICTKDEAVMHDKWEKVKFLGKESYSAYNVKSVHHGVDFHDHDEVAWALRYNIRSHRLHKMSSLITSTEIADDDVMDVIEKTVNGKRAQGYKLMYNPNQPWVLHLENGSETTYDIFILHIRKLTSTQTGVAERISDEGYTNLAPIYELLK